MTAESGKPYWVCNSFSCPASATNWIWSRKYEHQHEYKRHSNLMRYYILIHLPLSPGRRGPCVSGWPWDRLGWHGPACPRTPVQELINAPVFMCIHYQTSRVLPTSIACRHDTGCYITYLFMTFTFLTNRLDYYFFILLPTQHIWAWHGKSLFMYSFMSFTVINTRFLPPPPVIQTVGNVSQCPILFTPPKNK